MDSRWILEIKKKPSKEITERHKMRVTLFLSSLIIISSSNALVQLNKNRLQNLADDLGVTAFLQEAPVAKSSFAASPGFGLGRFRNQVSDHMWIRKVRSRSWQQVMEVEQQRWRQQSLLPRYRTNLRRYVLCVRLKYHS